jgi:hypothetical protein
MIQSFLRRVSPTGKVEGLRTTSPAGRLDGSYPPFPARSLYQTVRNSKMLPRVLPRNPSATDPQPIRKLKNPVFLGKNGVFLIEYQVGTLRIADQHAELAFVAVDHEVVPAKGEVEPGGGGWPADDAEQFGVRQEPHVIVERLPIRGARPAGKMAGAVGCAFVDQFHGGRYDSGCQ